MNAAIHLIQDRFERAASRCAEVTPLVDQAPFEPHPETQAAFSMWPASAAGISG
ncbi:hypothetical protein [Bradyrhizobium glycinis]|uniref:hypothetical protein n=1 Tax=Bradyrhizobium glycinis TaxID=2751812 RepID=UPI0018D72E38|nr:hypothetical protein [Bradyrhizobium glycinis]MBH5370023.1 hypothetical protein [Bradyrhizobium glycinis]